jgi:CDP-diacylglycerol--glycerol-3-phosphate 3-phosphatidyltransferase
MKMNLPNKLTILRVILVPFFVFFMLVPDSVFSHDYSKWIALVLFCVASITDFLDGHIARKYDLVTNFGKFMDPLADKLLTCSAFICLIVTRQDALPAWIVIVIIAREFVISGFRLVASDNGVVIAASYWGKFKTNFQMFAIILLIANLGGHVAAILEQILIYIALILTVVSLIDYLAKNIDVLKEGGSAK